MPRTVTATEARTKLLSLLNDVSDGEEIEVTRHGRRVARLVAAVSRPEALRDSMAGSAVQLVDDELLFSAGEEWEAS